jgi:hypothetical protein
MRVSITTDPHARTLTITVTDAEWEQTQQRSFYQGEQAVQRIVTAVGREGEGSLTRRAFSMAQWPETSSSIITRASLPAVW